MQASRIKFDLITLTYNLTYHGIDISTDQRIYH
jgi:hypothetical protein